MGILLVGLALITATFVTSVPVDKEAKILHYENTNNGSGNYYFRYETSNNITREETGQLVNPGQPDEHIDVYGFYSYEKPDGEIEIVYYNANENGHQIRKPVVQVQVQYEVSPGLLATALG